MLAHFCSNARAHTTDRHLPHCLPDSSSRRPIVPPTMRCAQAVGCTHFCTPARTFIPQSPHIASRAFPQHPFQRQGTLLQPAFVVSLRPLMAVVAISCG